MPPKKSSSRKPILAAKRRATRTKPAPKIKSTAPKNPVGLVNGKPPLTALQKLELRLDEEREAPWAHLKGFKPLKPGEKQIDDLDEDPDDRLSVIEQRLLQFCDRMGGFHLRLNKWGWRV